jgi:uncharacterized protein (TIGR00106 family)
MGSPRRARSQGGQRPASPPATEGLSPLDRDRAGSLADEGGSAGASVEAANGPEASDTALGLAVAPAPERREARSGSLLCELSIIPLGRDIHMSDELAEVLEVIDASGLVYQLGPAGTCIEGSWDEVMPVVRACHDRARDLSKHVITILKIEDDEGQRNKISRNVQSVESKSDRPLSTANDTQGVGVASRR